MSKIFKPSRTIKTTQNILKTYIQTSVFWIIFLLLIPAFLIKIQNEFRLGEFQNFKILGILTFLVFSIIALWSAYEMSAKGQGTPLPMDCANNLVTSGPYRVWRNPMAVSGISQAIAIGLYNGSYLVIVYAVIGGLLWHILVRPLEEKDLENRFGKEYLAYKKRIRNWLPNFMEHS